LDGKYRNILIKETAQPLGLTLMDQYIYWSDTQTKAIERANKVTGADHETICDNIENLTEIKAVAQSRQMGVNPCSIHNGACSHLCLFRPQGLDLNPMLASKFNYHIYHQVIYVPVLRMAILAPVLQVFINSSPLN
jgi:hypothetical protein